MLGEWVLLTAPAELLQRLQHQTCWPGPRVLDGPGVREGTQVLKQAVLNSGDVTSGKSLAKPQIPHLRAVTTEPTLCGAGRVNERVESPELPSRTCSSLLLFQAIKAPCWLDFLRKNKWKMPPTPTHRPHQGLHS